MCTPTITHCIKYGHCGDSEMLHLLDFLPLIVLILMKKVGKCSCGQLNCLDVHLQILKFRTVLCM